MDENHASQDDFDAAALNGMLRGELAAVETYNQAVRNIQCRAIIAELERIRDEHQLAVCSLRRHVRDLKEFPASNSGVWGFFTSAVTGLASIVGDAALLVALKRGESHGVSTYREGMGNPDLPDAIRFMVGSQLLPRCQEHLERLEELSAAATTTMNDPITR